MSNNRILSSFILFSLSLVFLILSFIFFNFFENDRVNSGLMTADVISASGFQIHYYPGLIFFGISLFTSLAGIILFIIHFFLKRSINEDQKQKEMEHDTKKVLFNVSFAVFVVVVVLLFLTLAELIIFQQYIPSIIGISHESTYVIDHLGFVNNYYPAESIIGCTLVLSIIGIIIFASGFFKKKMATERKTQENI